MDNQIQVFTNPVFGAITTIRQEDGKVLFKANDVAMALGYKDYKRAITDHCRLVGVLPTNDALGRERPTKYIPESDVYRLVMRSKLPEAEKFQDWVCEEVLPSIRKNGAYMTDSALEQALTDPDFGIRLLTNLKKEQEVRKELELKTREQQLLLEQKDERIEELDKENKKLAESSEYCRKVLMADSLVPITQIAQDYGTTANAMNEYLHNNGIQYKRNNKGPWIIYAEFIASGYVHSETFLYTDSKGIDHVKNNTKWTQKGRLFLYKWFKKRDILPVTERPEGYVLPYEIRNCKSKIKDPAKM